MQVSNRHPAIAQEGWLYIAASLLITTLLLFTSFWFLSIIPIALTTLLLFVYRDPERQIPSVPLAIVSPVDGVVQAVAEKFCKLNSENMLWISIKLNTLGVYSGRSPIEGKIKKQVYNKDAGQLQFANWVQTDEGDDILWDVEPKGMGRPRCYVQAGERIGQGQRCGFLPFSAMINLYIPVNSTISIKKGERLFAGQSIVAMLVHQTGATIVSENQNQV